MHQCIFMYQWVLAVQPKIDQPRMASGLPEKSSMRCLGTALQGKVIRTASEPYPCVVFGLTDSEASRKVFPFGFNLRYSVTLDGPDSISTSLMVLNTSDTVGRCSDPLVFSTPCRGV